MSLYDDTNPNHLAYLERHRARWTPEREQALQEHFVAIGLQSQAECDEKATRRAARAGA